MTAVSLINPYAPQPAQTTNPHPTATTAIAPAAAATAGGGAQDASGQSGQGAGNGTGNGGTQLAFLMEKGRLAMTLPQEASPKSIVEAQSSPGPATAYLAEQARRRADASAAEARDLDAEAARAKAEAAEAAKPDHPPPNPLPTAPILPPDPTKRHVRPAYSAALAAVLFGCVVQLA